MKNSQSGRTESASHQKANKHKAIICSIQISISSCEVLQHSWGATVSPSQKPKASHCNIKEVMSSLLWNSWNTIEGQQLSQQEGRCTHQQQWRAMGTKRIAFFLPWSMSHHISLVYKNHANHHFLEQSLLFQKHI